MSGALDAALAYADRLGWPMFPCEPGGKDPITRLVRHGVKDASTDPDLIRRWWAEQPDANPAVACGPPGPVVLDADDPAHPQARKLLDQLADAPRAASVRGPHVYLSGAVRNRTLGFGELRSTGWYVLVPPAIHPSGREYVWLAEPWHRRLPPVPAELAAAPGPGCGVMPDLEQVPPGQMYGHLLDLAVRLARAGIVDEARIARILLAEFEAVRVPGAAYNGSPTDTRRIARWAARSEIAERERRLAERRGRNTA